MKPPPLSAIPRPPGELPPGRHGDYYRLAKGYIDAGWPTEMARDKAVSQIVARDGKADAARAQGRLF